MDNTNPDGVECKTEFKGHQIRIFSTWTQDARLYVDGVCRDRSIQRVSLRKTRILSTTLRVGADDYLVEVFAKALLSVKLQLRINGRQVAGEVL